MKKLRLGVIGMSEGNGHPYSWSAICNGYNKEVMAGCPFPVIPEYLSQESFPAARIPNVQVTHIWTQDKKLSKHIAQASLIEHVVKKSEDMIGEIDAVLLARDDAENHLEMARPFLVAGVPIYIDKPLATKVRIAQKLYALQKYSGQLFTCSALRYAPELMLSDDQKREIGQIKKITAQISKDWLKYGVHIIEPVIKMLDSRDEITKKKCTKHGEKVVVSVVWKSGIQTDFTTYGTVSVPITISINGSLATKTLEFTHTFRAFKNALTAFISRLPGEEDSEDTQLVSKAIAIIETYYAN